MRARMTLASLALGLLLAACGQSASQRADIASYLKRVNKMEAALAAPLTAVMKAGQQFQQTEHAGGSLTNLVYESQEQQLTSAWSQIRIIRGRLAAIRAPAPAAHLRALLLQIIDGQARQTREVAELVAFLPRYNAALAALGPVSGRLRSALSQPAAYGTAAVAALDAAKATALRQFKAQVDGILQRLAGLRPPAVSKPDYDSQIASLRGMSASAGRLASALGGGGAANVQQLLTQFDRAATSGQSIAAQKARIAAARTYDGESAKLASLARAAELERLRLARTAAT
jgi:hypothetical protein